MSSSLSTELTLLVPLSRLADALLAWNLGPLPLGQDKHGQKTDSPLSWALSERQLQVFNNLAVYSWAQLFHECSHCFWSLWDYACEEKCGLVNIMAWPGEHSSKTLQFLQDGLNLHRIYCLWRRNYSKILPVLQFLHFVKCIYDRYCHNFFLVFNNINKVLLYCCMSIVTCLNTPKFKLHVDNFLPSWLGSVNLQNLQKLHFGSKTRFCSGSCKTA